MALKSKLSHAGWFAEKVSGVIFFFLISTCILWNRPFFITKFW